MLHNVPVHKVRMRQMTVGIEVLQLKSAQVYILEKTASLPVTDNRSLETRRPATLRPKILCFMGCGVSKSSEL